MRLLFSNVTNNLLFCLINNGRVPAHPFEPAHFFLFRIKGRDKKGTFLAFFNLPEISRAVTAEAKCRKSKKLSDVWKKIKHKFAIFYRNNPIKGAFALILPKF